MLCNHRHISSPNRHLRHLFRTVVPSVRDAATLQRKVYACQKRED
jgi:hypothetical protein